MRRGERLAGRPFRVREPFEERLFRFAFFESRVRSERSGALKNGSALAFIYSRGGSVTVFHSAPRFFL
jgi:hypothetical protein